MFIEPGNLLLVGSILLLISIIAGKTTSRLGVPTLIFFLIVGILAGSEGIGGIHFDNTSIAQLIGITALNFILFSGGLDTNWQSIKPWRCTIHHRRFSYSAFSWAICTLRFWIHYMGRSASWFYSFSYGCSGSVFYFA